MSKILAAIETMRPEAAAMLERLYAPLVRQLNLTPEQSEQLYQVLLDNKMSGLAQRADLLCHGDPGRMSKNVADCQTETDARLQTLLGDANFAQYQEYQAGVGDRGMLELMKNNFTESPLTEEQQNRLLKAMNARRKAVGAASGSDAGFSIADTSDVMKQKLTRQESIDQHVLQQAASFLSPAQLQILSLTQAKTMALRKDGYAKAQEMFGDRGKPVEPRE
jgi:hypothetical protein